MTRFNKVLAISLAAGVALGLPAATLAQSSSEMTAAQITEKLNKQKTRGLVIVPTGNQATTAQTDTTSVATPAAYNEVAREDQVNVQVSFDFDSASLREDQKPKLAALCEAMKSVDAALFQIIGHTDSSGSAAYNQRLSLLRAQEVKRFMVNDCGIADTRLEAVGMGESKPFDPADPKADANRRVEFQALG